MPTMEDHTNQDPLLKSKWNFSAIIATLVILAMNVIAGTALIMGSITWQEWLAGIGAINGTVLGWVSKALTS